MIRNAIAGMAAISLAVTPIAVAAQDNTRAVDAGISLGATGWSPLIPDEEDFLLPGHMPWEVFLIGLGILGGALFALGGDVEEDDGPGDNASPGTGG